MEGQINEKNVEDIEDEEFKCCVCLELMYKPVALACGHICCFWCVYWTMIAVLEPRCPICRHPYNHFPNVCRLLHFVIQTLYPIAYKKREIQVAEEEREHGYSSPQFLEDISASFQTARFSSYGNSYHCNINSSTKKEDHSFSTDSSKSFIFDKHVFSEVVSQGPIDMEACGSKVVTEGNRPDDGHQHSTAKKFSSLDFACPACKNLLFQPVVLNCGHVHCENCLSNQQNGHLKCQVCESPNPNGLPKICLVLDNLIAEQFPELHGQRRESLLKQANNGNGGPSNSASQTSQRTTNTDDYALWWTGRGPKVHILVGCDYCGMSPIIGERYKCLDCTEKIGFDLCKMCYVRSSILPGRFNQQHRLDHRFEIKQPGEVNHVFIRQEMGESDDDDDDDFSTHDAPDDMVDGVSNTAIPDTPPPS